MKKSKADEICRQFSKERPEALCQAYVMFVHTGGELPNEENTRDMKCEAHFKPFRKGWLEKSAAAFSPCGRRWDEEEGELPS